MTDGKNAFSKLGIITGIVITLSRLHFQAQRKWHFKEGVKNGGVKVKKEVKDACNLDV